MDIIICVIVLTLLNDNWYFKINGCGSVVILGGEFILLLPRGWLLFGVVVKFYCI